MRDSHTSSLRARGPLLVDESGARTCVRPPPAGPLIATVDRVADTGVDEASAGRVSVLVNGGGYGFAEREAFAPFIERYLGDSTDSDATRTFNATRGSHSYSIYVDFTPQRP